MRYFFLSCFFWLPKQSGTFRDFIFFCIFAFAFIGQFVNNSGNGKLTNSLYLIGKKITDKNIFVFYIKKLHCMSKTFYVMDSNRKYQKMALSQTRSLNVKSKGPFSL